MAGTYTFSVTNAGDADVLSAEVLTSFSESLTPLLAEICRAAEGNTHVLSLKDLD